MGGSGAPESPNQCQAEHLLTRFRGRERKTPKANGFTSHSLAKYCTESRYRTWLESKDLVLSRSSPYVCQRNARS